MHQTKDVRLLVKDRKFEEFFIIGSTPTKERLSEPYISYIHCQKSNIDDRRSVVQDFCFSDGCQVQ